MALWAETTINKMTPTWKDAKLEKQQPEVLQRNKKEFF